jgi:hypothetical protein
MENEGTSGQESRTGISWLWFLGGCALSITTLCSLVLSVLLVASTALNAYLAWTLSGYEIYFIRPVPVSTAVVGARASEELAMAPAGTPTPTPTGAPTSMPTLSTLEAEFATLAAIATQVADAAPTNTPTCTPTPIAPDASPVTGMPTPEASTAPMATLPQAEVTAAPGTPSGGLAASANSYNRIPIEGGREIRPAEEHADLNLKLRDPQPAQFEPTLVDIADSGVDPQAPRLSAVFQPDFVATYAVHDWDWNCNCKGDLLQDGSAVLVGIRTTPGEPVFIPQTERDIYAGKYYAVVLYASEDSLTLQYARRGNVVEGFTVHYLGLQTDPNLLALFRESQGNDLPGLTLDTPVGLATDELIVAMRDNGTFLDARSRLDWWD